MSKFFLSITVFALAATSAFGQIKKVDDIKKSLETTNKDTIAWVYGGVLNAGINEGFLHNWSAGGEIASLSVNGVFHGFLNRLHHRDIWSNNLDLNYGLNYAYSTGFLPHKTDDRIDFTSKYGIKYDSSKYIYFTGLFNFKSQFTRGYDYTRPNWDSAAVSNFFSPAYFTTAIGMEYRRGSDVSLFLSPIAGRLTVASKFYTDQSPHGAFGVDSNKTAYYQFGAYFSGRYQANLTKKIVYRTRLDLYSDYLAKDTKNDSGRVIKKDSPANISVLFDNFLAWKISKYLNLTFGLTLAYDNNIPYVKVPTPTTGPNANQEVPGNNIGWLQISQVFTVGLEYKF